MNEAISETNDDKKQAAKNVVLELRKVYCREASMDAVKLRGTSVKLLEGDLMMIHLGRRQTTRSFASLIQGLVSPASGEIWFEQHPWNDNSIERQFRMRSRIGRVFEDRAWINNLNVTENVTLRAEHHSFPPAKLMQQITHWTTKLQVPPLNRQRPAFVEASALQLYQWLRAVLGEPSLLILERPMKSLPPEKITPLVAGINEIRSQGTAVIWLAGNEYETKQAFTGNVVHYESNQRELVPMTDGTPDDRENSR